MQLNFTIMHRNEKVTDVYIDGANVRMDRYLGGIWQPFHRDKPTMRDVYNFLESRCYEDGRADLDEILAYAGLTENNPWEWCKISHGVTYEDFLWIRFEGEELTWEEVRVR